MMIRAILAAAFALLLASIVHAGFVMRGSGGVVPPAGIAPPEVKQSAGKSDNADNGPPWTTAVAFPSNVTKDNRIVVIALDGGATHTVSDSRGNTYTKRATYGGDGDTEVVVWDAVANATGSCTVTMSMSTHGWRAMYVTELGGAEVPAYQASAGDAGFDRTGASITSPSVTTTQDNTLVIGAIFLGDGGVGIAPGGGETERYDDGDWVQAQDKIVATAGTTTHKWTLGSSDDAMTVVAAYGGTAETSSPVGIAHGALVWKIAEHSASAPASIAFDEDDNEITQLVGGNAHIATAAYWFTPGGEVWEKTFTAQTTQPGFFVMDLAIFEAAQ